MARTTGPVLVRDVARVRHLFGAEHLGFVLDAIIAGNSPAHVWADDLAMPRTALVWDGAHSLYLAGAVDQPEVWRELFDREVASAQPDFLKAYVTDAAAGTVFTGWPLERRERVLYRGTRAAIAGWAERVPAGFHISAIDHQFTALRALANFAAVVEEIASCWKSVDDFRRSGFGFVAHDAETIVSWCTAEYVSDRQCGTGVETVSTYGGRGFATLTASAFLDHCLEHGLTAHWDAWTSNLASVAVAEKVGFRKVGTYSIFVAAAPGPRPGADTTEAAEPAIPTDSH